MLPQRLEPGKKWIESELRAALKGRSASVVDRISWRLDFTTQHCTLDARINGESKRWTFRYEDVSDCLEDREAQREIRWQLRFR